MNPTFLLLKEAACSMTLLELRALAILPSLIHQALLGQLLGDAHASRSSPTSNTRIEWSFGVPYALYAAWINSLFATYCGSPLKAKKSGQWRLKTLSLPVFNFYHALFYVQVAGAWVKIVPATIGSLMTPIVLAHLIMSDGSYNKIGGEVFIYVNAYSYEDCKRLAASITAMGVNTTVRTDRYGADGTTKQYKLAIVKSQLPALHSLVVPHMYKGMLYRVGL